MVKTNIAALHQRLANGEVVILDGAIGTELQRRGVPMDYGAWCAFANQTYPDTVRQLHLDYIQAGADVITTNTFSSARHSLKAAGREDQVKEINTGAVVLAREAREQAAGGWPVYIAGSMSPHGALAPASALDKPNPQELQASYREQANLLAEAGVDLLLLEMMRDVEVGTVMAEAAAATGLPVWVGFSAQVDSHGTLKMRGAAAGQPGPRFDEVYNHITALGWSAVAVMHTEIQDIAPTLNAIKAHWKGPLGAYAHSGRWVRPNWQFDNVIPPDKYLMEARKWVQLGAQILGGCCGTGPEHIRALKRGLPQRLLRAGGG